MMILSSTAFVFLLGTFSITAVKGERNRISQSPCYFNPLCTCSKMVPNFGLVSCVNIQLTRIPASFNVSKMNGLNLENNNLRAVENFAFYNTGIITLKISKNPIYVIPRELLSGLEFSLHDLELSDINLISVPTEALSRLKKLRVLNLSGNEISEISSYNWINIENALETLILKRNAIVHISRNAFGGFKKLKLLDLSENLLTELPAVLFNPELSGQLIGLYLNDNRLQRIPYRSLQSVRLFNVVDLSYNLITDISAIPDSFNGNSSFVSARLLINTLRLDYNRIEVLVAESFRHFESLDKVYLNGNQINTIQPDVFRNTPVSELHLVKCSLTAVPDGMLYGLEKKLQSLDLSNNQIRSLSQRLMSNFEQLKKLTIRNNPIDTISVPETRSSLEYLDIQTRFGVYFPINNLSRLRNLRSLMLSNIKKRVLSMDDFRDFTLNIEQVSITNAELQIIKSHAFFHINRITKLDLSYNSISEIHPDSFIGVGNSLENLRLSHAFSSLLSVPVEIFRHLSNLRILDLSYNEFEMLQETTFYRLGKIRNINLQDCRLKILHRNTFQASIHTEVKSVLLSYNFLKVISSYTFADLRKLQLVNLEDNEIVKIEKHAFINLENVQNILLRGNKITVIETEAFQNLPNLENLDLAYNELVFFDFTFFDQVGTMAISLLNVSFNHLHLLGENYATYDDTDTTSNTNFEIMDLSNNNISTITNGYFQTVRSSMFYLRLSHNLLSNITCDYFNDLHQLEWLDLSHNRIFNVEYCAFRRVRKLQVLYLNNNILYDLVSNMFNGIINLRIVDFSHNKLRFIPDYLFKEESIEFVNLAHNRLTQIPFKSFTREAASYLCALDLSYNGITALNSPALFSNFQELTALHLSGNNISRIADASFSHMKKLIHLDLSHNNRSNIENNPVIFSGLENSLQTLYLKNVSLHELPHLSLPSLLHLHLTDNNINDIPAELALNISKLRILDISGNEFFDIPVTIFSLSELRNFYVARNNITALDKHNLLNGIPFLRILDLSNIPLHMLEAGALSKLQCLFGLHINLHYRLDNFNIPAFISENSGLHYIEIFADEHILEKQLYGKFPPKLRNITITGRRLQIIKSEIFEEIPYPDFSFTLTNTTVEMLPGNLFRHTDYLNSASLDIRGNNLNSISRELIGHATALEQLSKIYLSGNSWICNCQIGWVGVWNRKRRLAKCAEYEDDNDQDFCYASTEDDFRLLRCRNSNDFNGYLLDVLKNDLDCAWNRSSKIVVSAAVVILIITSVLRYTV